MVTALKCDSFIIYQSVLFKKNTFYLFFLSKRKCIFHSIRSWTAFFWSNSDIICFFLWGAYKEIKGCDIWQVEWKVHGSRKSLLLNPTAMVPNLYSKYLQEMMKICNLALPLDHIITKSKRGFPYIPLNSQFTATFWKVQNLTPLFVGLPASHNFSLMWLWPTSDFMTKTGRGLHPLECVCIYRYM